MRADNSSASRPGSDCVHQRIGLAAYLDAGIGIFRRVLPEYGFKLVMPPPLPCGTAPQAFASAWQRGQSEAVSHRAITPSLALLRAAEFEYLKRRRCEVSLGCGRCRGVGWFVTRSGAIEMCRHGK